jgi:hypothetical protein
VSNYGEGPYGSGPYGIGPPPTVPNEPDAQIPGTARARHELKTSWDKSTTSQGWFILDQSLLDRPDLLAPAAQLVSSFGGTYLDADVAEKAAFRALDAADRARVARPLSG